MIAWLMLNGLLLLSLLPNSINSERVCYSCSSMKETETCQHVLVCNKDEICFVQKYFTLGNETRYDFGCTYQELCQKDITGHILGKRNEHAHIACQKCCNDSNICNNDRSCGNVITRQKCLSCDHVENPKVCNNTITCDKGEVCFLHKYLTETQHVKYDLGCKHSSLCLHGSKTNILGRRTSAGRHLTCERCCDGTELCNTDLQCTHQDQKTINASCRSTNECGSNLVCSSDRCQCASRDDFWDNTACITKKLNGEVCADNIQCYAPFLCIQNKCSCHSTQYWNGTMCIPRKSVNFTCDAPGECLESLFCLHGKCQCDYAQDYWMGSACTTRKTFNSTCTSNEECATFRCIDFKCVCPLISEYWSGSQCLRGIECADLPIEKDGIYTIYPSGKNEPVSVFCIVRQHEKWTVIQRRINGSVDFYRAWNEYKHGFGSAYGEYWLGNDNIHLISSNGGHELSIYMAEADTTHHTANYSTFKLSDEDSMYVLTATGYSGDTSYDCIDYPDDKYKSNGRPFTTKDRDYDNSSGNLAVIQKSAWWFNTRKWSDLNKAYFGHTGNMYWASWSSAISKSIMMIKRS